MLCSAIPNVIFQSSSSFCYLSDFDDEFREQNRGNVSNMSNNYTKRAEGYFSSSSDSSIDSNENSSSALPAARKKSCNNAKKNAAASHLLKENRVGKENQIPRLGQNKKGRSKSLNNVNASPAFGQGFHRRHRRVFSFSPVDKPMILSRRLSYKINNSTTPDKSPVVATKLAFSPVAPNRHSKGRRSRHRESSLERLGASNRPAVAKKARKTKRNSI